MSPVNTPLTDEPTDGQRARILWLSTGSFTLMFAVWLMLGMLSIPIKNDLGLTDGQLYNLTIAAILSGSLLRFNFGVWTDKFGGRRVLTALLLLTVIPTVLVSQVENYTQLLICALMYGIAGNSFSIGIAWNAAWFPKNRQGLALGIFGAGNVGASVTKLTGPFIIAAVPAAGLFGGFLPGGWRFIPLVYAVLLVVAAMAVWFLAPKQDRCPAKGRSFGETTKPLSQLRVWEYCLHYVVVFGAYVAFSNLLPMYYYKNYGTELASSFDLAPELITNFKAITNLKGAEYEAAVAAIPGAKADLAYLNKWIGFLAAICFVFPASLLRPLGGYLSDKIGAKVVMVAVFWSMLASGLVLSLPLGLNVWVFTVFLFLLGAGMGIGKASVYKLIPDYFPKDVGAVGGLVGMLGALGGVLIPLGVVPLQASTGMPQMLFGVLLALTIVSTAWFHLDIVFRKKGSKTEMKDAITQPQLAGASS